MVANVSVLIVVVHITVTIPVQPLKQYSRL